MAGGFAAGFARGLQGSLERGEERRAKEKEAERKELALKDRFTFQLNANVESAKKQKADAQIKLGVTADSRFESLTPRGTFAGTPEEYNAKRTANREEVLAYGSEGARTEALRKKAKDANDEKFRNAQIINMKAQRRNDTAKLTSKEASDTTTAAALVEAADIKAENDRKKASDIAIAKVKEGETKFGRERRLSIEKFNRVQGEKIRVAEDDFIILSETAEVSVKQVKDLLTHPGFEASVGVTEISQTGRQFIPGSDRSDFEAAFDQVKGEQFLTAVQKLKGSGQITEIEGAKATAAISRMKLSQSEDSFREAAADYIAIIEAGVSRAGKGVASLRRSIIPIEEPDARFDIVEGKEVFNTTGVKFTRRNGKWVDKDGNEFKGQ